MGLQCTESDLLSSEVPAPDVVRQDKQQFNVQDSLQRKKMDSLGIYFFPAVLL